MSTVAVRVAECRERLSADGFYARDDGLYCTRDYQSQFGVKCCYCGQYIAGEVVAVLHYTYHDVCFCCSVCRPVIELDCTEPGADLGGVTRVTSHPPPMARQPISCYYYACDLTHKCSNFILP